MQYLKEEVRNRILASAKQEFLEQGYKNASIRNIAELAKTSLGNIYRYFIDKEALFLAVTNNLIEAGVVLFETNFSLSEQDLAVFPDKVLDYVLAYRQELAIVKSGLKEHFDSYIEALIEVTAKKFSLSMQRIYPQVATNFGRDFYYNMSASFLFGLRTVIDCDKHRAEKKQGLRELIWFFFSNIDKRFNFFEALD
ncbi:MAG: TetR/AcrR family transcriptional regulator [Clostridia bacterium]